MEISQGLLCRMILYAAGVGAMLGVIYDVFRIVRIATCPAKNTAPKRPGLLRRLLPAENILFAILVFLEDILFSLIAGVVVAIFIFNINDGQIRWFALAGAILGFFIYYQTVGRLVISVADIILRILRRTIAFLVRITFRPIAFLIGWLCRAAVVLYMTIDAQHTSKKLIAASLRDAAHGFRL